MGPNRSLRSEPIRVEMQVSPLLMRPIIARLAARVSGLIAPILGQDCTKSVWINEQPKGYPASLAPDVRV
jgi:hypothetical protein